MTPGERPPGDGGFDGAVRRTEYEPFLLGVGGHLLAAGRRPRHEGGTRSADVSAPTGEGA